MVEYSGRELNIGKFRDVRGLGGGRRWRLTLGLGGKDHLGWERTCFSSIEKIVESRHLSDISSLDKCYDYGAYCAFDNFVPRSQLFLVPRVFSANISCSSSILHQQREQNSFVVNIMCDLVARYTLIIIN